MDVLREAASPLIPDLWYDRTCACVFITSLLIVILVNREFRGKLYRLPPGPPTKFHYGNLKQFDDDPKIYMTLAKIAKEYGKIFRVYTGPRLVVVLNHYDVVKEALIKKQIDFSGRPRNLSNSVQSDHYHDLIFAPYSARWKLHRKIFNQALRKFASGDLLVENLNKSMEIANEFVKPHLGEVFDPFHFVTLIVYNFICAMCVGKTFDPENEEFKTLCFRRRKITDTIGNGFDADFFPYKWILESERIKKAQNLMNELFDYAKSIITDHKRNFSPDAVKDFTDHILAAQLEIEDSSRTLSDRHLINIIMDIFSAGTETTVNTMYWILLYVASYPEVQRKVQRQIDEAIGRHEEIDLSKRKELPLVDATVYEVMRHRPAVPLGIPRSTICDTKIGEYDIPKGTDVIVNIWTLHHDPDEWEDPENFRPERFLKDDGSLASKPRSFLPFGTGRRICIGEVVAKPEISLVTARLLQKYSFSLPPDCEPSFEPADLAFTSYSKNYSLVMEKR